MRATHDNLDRRRIVVLGGGFEGCFTAKRLEHHFATDPDVEISLVNRDNYFVFQPLLPEVAAVHRTSHHIDDAVKSRN